VREAAKSWFRDKRSGITDLKMDRIAKLVSGRLKAQSALGPHPDPELLSAFAENALPEADRGQLLQHLGACSDCREILYLALPHAPEAQKVLVLQPRPFKRWALGWGALLASVAIAAVFFSISRPAYRNQSAPAAAALPAAASENKIAADKAPPELDQIQAARDGRRSKMAVALEKSEPKPHPQAKHMTGKMQSELVFEESGQVRVQAPAKSSDMVAGLVGNDERLKQRPGVGGANGPATQTGSAGKLEYFGYASPELSKSRADQRGAVGQPIASQADAANGANSLQVNARNVPSPSVPAQESTVGGNLGGTISDASGAVVSNAKITVSGPIGTKSATSDREGKFSFDRLTPGSYSLKAEASGFKATEVQQVAVVDNKSAALQVKLELGTASEVVEVSSAAPIVGEATAAPAAAPAVNSTAGLVTGKQTAQLSMQKAAVARTKRQEVGGGAGSGAGAPIFRWTLSPEGTVQRSGDSGKSWQAVSVAPGATFRALSAVGASVWAGGKVGALYHSADSGQSWAKVEPVAASKKLDQDILKVDFSDLLTGTVNAANREVWTTSDGGLTWQRK
jgi:hypothetical protein